MHTGARRNHVQPIGEAVAQRRNEVLLTLGVD
jgi:hypothetical protein